MPLNRIVQLLNTANWDVDHERMQALKEWQLYPIFLETYRDLNEGALYHSRIHGSGHIHRTLLFAALIAQGEGLEEDVVRQYFRAACYHDVGRTFDGYDIYHGARSALRLAELTGQEGDALIQLQAAVTAHSRPDRDMEGILRSYSPADYAATHRLACLLKDADNLDRVRLGDLKPSFLRHDSAKDLVDFAHRLFTRDQAAAKGRF